MNITIPCTTASYSRQHGNTTVALNEANAPDKINRKANKTMKTLVVRVPQAEGMTGFLILPHYVNVYHMPFSLIEILFILVVVAYAAWDIHCCSQTQKRLRANLTPLNNTRPDQYKKDMKHHE